MTDFAALPGMLSKLSKSDRNPTPHHSALAEQPRALSSCELKIEKIMGQSPSPRGVPRSPPRHSSSHHTNGGQSL